MPTFGRYQTELVLIFLGHTVSLRPQKKSDADSVHNSGNEWESVFVRDAVDSIFYRMPFGPNEIPKKTEAASNFLLLVVSNIYVHFRKFSDFATIHYIAKTESEPRIFNT